LTYPNNGKSDLKIRFAEKTLSMEIDFLEQRFSVEQNAVVVLIGD